MADMEPEIGDWYYDTDSGRSFEVLNVDEDDGLVEIRFEDGDNAQFLLDAWYEMELEPALPPPGWNDQNEEAGREPPGGEGDRLSNDAFRRATQWGERNPDDFDELGRDA